MNVIQPNCRMQFTSDDVEFILEVLGPESAADSLAKLLADEEARDVILDVESLFRALLEQRGCLRVSTHFYFYVLVRHVFKRSGIEDREVADYVAEVLAEYSRIENTRCVLRGKPEPLDYFFEMVAALQQRSEEHTSELQSQSNLVCRLLLEKKKKKRSNHLYNIKRRDIDSEF